MEIKKAGIEDFPDLARLDQSAYGETGADEKYFQDKIAAPGTEILVGKNGEEIRGYAVIELYSGAETPRNFRDLKSELKLEGKWLFIVGFTTATNYSDIEEDGKLLSMAEETARQNGCDYFLVPLCKEHPFSKNNVFQFWENNGYEQVGEISWVPNEGQALECFLYGKRLN